VQGGIDLVTGREPDFRLTSIVEHPSVKLANINPYTTVIVAAARAMPGGLSEENVSLARRGVTQQLNFGLDPRLLADPIETSIGTDNVAVMVRSSEAFGEMIRRTASSLQAAGFSLSADQVVAAIGDDLSDGVLDGRGAARADQRVAAVANLTSAQVLVETLSNSLRVDGTPAAEAMDAAIRTTHPGVGDAGLTAGVRVNAELLQQARTTVAAAQVLAPSVQLSSIAMVLADISVDSLPRAVEAVLPGDTSVDLDAAILLASSASEEQLAVVNEAMREPGSTQNQPPQFGATPASSVLVGATYQFEPLASDADGDTLAFEIANLPAWASFDVVSGGLTGTPDAGHIGTYSGIIISADDGSATATLGPFTITVSGQNSAPVISGAAPASVAVGQAYSFQPIASDADGDSLQFSIANRPAWATFDGSSGRLSGTPASAGTYSDIVISVSDGTASSSLPAFTVSVNPVTPDNSAPIIAGTPAGSVTEDSTYAFRPSASDADGDTLSFSISGRPVWANFDSATGRLSGTPDNSHVGSHANIVISVTDGQSVVSLNPFSIQVLNSNDAPSIAGNPPISATAGEPYSFTPTASDPDGDQLTFSIGNRPAWASFDPATGRLWGTPGAEDAGSYADVRIRVSDGTESTALPAFSVVVDNSPEQTGSVSLTWAAPATRSDGEALPLAEIAGYTLYYGTVLGDYPNSLDIDSAAATSITVDDLPLATYYFVLTTRDTGGLESEFSAPAEREAL
jgi:hypothetical protein